MNHHLPGVPILAPQDIQASQSAQKFLTSSGLSNETIQAFQLGVDTTKTASGRIGIPFYQNGQPLSYMTRAIFPGSTCQCCGQFVTATQIVQQKNAAMEKNPQVAKLENCNPALYTNPFDYTKEMCDLREYIIKVSPVDNHGDLRTFLEQPSGSALALCPMHDENVPSFSIRPSLHGDFDVWHCYGQCNQGGTIIDFEMAHGKCSTPLTAIDNIHAEMNTSFKDDLAAYIKAYDGYKAAASSWKSCPHCNSPDSKAHVAWLVGQYPKYVMEKGFDKSTYLYQSPKSQQVTHLVEGASDAWAMHEAGFEGAAAYLGSKLSHAQTELVCKKTSSIVLVPDQDETGVFSTQQNMHALQAEDHNLAVKVVYTLEYKGQAVKDVAEFLQKFGAKALKEHISNHQWDADAYDIHRYIANKSVATKSDITFINTVFNALLEPLKRLEIKLKSGAVNYAHLQASGWAKDAPWLHDIIQKTITPGQEKA